MQRRTVAFVQEKETGLYVYCAGVWAGYNKILTAGHCVYHGTIPEDWPETRLYDPVGHSIRYSLYTDIGKFVEISRDALITKYNEDLDLGLVEVSDPIPSHPTADFELGPISQGDRVFVMGHPAFLTWTFSSGDVSAIREVDGVMIIETTAPVYFGNSGGGMFTNECHLIGVASYLHPGPRIAGFVHRNYLLDFVK